MTFSSKEYLEAHQKAIHENIRYQCKICHREFSYESTLKKHEKDNHSNGPIRCNQCTLEVKNNIELYKHFLKVHKRLIFTKCNCCEKHLSVTSLAKHFKKDHKGESKDKLLQLYKQNGPYKCKECPKEYDFPNSLAVHVNEKHKRIGNTNVVLNKLEEYI